MSALLLSGSRHNAGFFVNVIFESAPAALAALKARFGMSEDVFRVIFTSAPAPKPAA